MLGSVAKKNNILIFFTTFVIIVASIIGITKLEVENSFINYFNKETEIYKGMKKIDDELGGTTPLDIIIKFPSKKVASKDDDEFSEWEEGNESDDDKSKYWFTRDKMDKILQVHEYLELFARNRQGIIFWFYFKSSRRFKSKRIAKFRNSCPL